MRPSRILLHPIFLGALILLLFNDFIAKIYYPGVISGKLSDVAGLIVLPLFIYSISPHNFKSTFRKVVLLLATAILFASLQSEIFLQNLNYLLHSLSLPFHNLTADLTDLLTLSILMFVLWFLMQFEKKKKHIMTNSSTGLLSKIVFGISLFSLVATSFTGTNTIAVNDPLSHKSSWEEVIQALHEELVNSGFLVTRNTIIKDSTQVIGFKLKLEPSSFGYMSESYNAELYLENRTSADSINISQFKMWQQNRKISDEFIDSVFINQIKPIIVLVQAKYR